jgi:hypothetical protein
MTSAPICAALLVVYATVCGAWDTKPHRAMTQAALDTLPQRYRAQLGPEAAALAETYCMLPDRYVELEQFGFLRKSPGPQTLEEMRAYCVRPDGIALHSFFWDREDDLGTLIYLMERILGSLSEKRNADAARYMGTLAHLIEDSLSPPHSVSEEKLQALSAGGDAMAMHRAIEKSLPEFSLRGRAPQVVGQGIMSAAEELLARVYAAAERNRTNLPQMSRAVARDDQVTLDAHRLRAGRAAAELLADALCTMFTMEGYEAR